MLQLLLKSYLAFLLIPLLTLALEPTDPSAFCERFLGDKDKASCMLKTAKNELDWYASAACNLQEDDQGFLSCLEEIKGAKFNPEALELCAKPHTIKDSERLSCIKKIKNKDYTRAQLKKCSEAGSPQAIEMCLYNNPQRKPAEVGRNQQGFQSLEVKK